MAKRKGLIERNTFVRGLITEASPLTFPENASIVEENFTLNRDGSRSRRLGLDFETGYTANESITEVEVTDAQINTYQWFNAGTTQNKNFIVVQIGSRLSFYDVEDSDTLSDNKRVFEIWMENYNLVDTTSDQISEAYTSFSVIRGLLVVTNERAHPFYVSYDSVTDTLQSGTIAIMTRDFTGVDDGFDNTYRPRTADYGFWYTGVDTTIPAVYNKGTDVLAHSYNLYNQGWDLRALWTCHRDLTAIEGQLDEADGLPSAKWNGTVAGSDPAWPSNSDQQAVGRIASLAVSSVKQDLGKFFPYQLNKSPIEDWQAPRGKNIINALDTVKSIFYWPLTSAATVEPNAKSVSLKMHSEPISAFSYSSSAFSISFSTSSSATNELANLTNNYPVKSKGVRATVDYTRTVDGIPTAYTGVEVPRSMLGFLDVEIPATLTNLSALTFSWVHGNAYWNFDLERQADITAVTWNWDISQAQLYYYTRDLHTEVERETQDYSFSTTASFAGRAWYTGLNSGTYQNYVFYSKTIDGHADLGLCYQEGDPTSEFNSDIIDTDGGYLVIPEAERIVNMIPMGRNLFVFATNGVWRISGGLDNFVATSNAVDKISGVGVESPQSIVAVENSLMFWSSGGIYAVTPTDATGEYGVKNVSETSVQTDFLGINKVARQNVKGAYDHTTKVITWMVNESPSYEATGGVENTNKYDTLYSFETVLGSFFKHKIATDTANLLPWVADIIQLPTTTEVGVSRDVYSNGVLVVSNGIQVVTDGVILPRDTLVQTKVMMVSLNTGGTPFITFGEFNNADFLDWYTHDTTGSDYVSRLVTGYELGGSLTKKKQATYLHMFFNRTETAFEGTDPSIEAVGESSCYVYPLWDFATPPTDAEFTANSFQTYRIPRWYATGGATYDYGQDVITSKSKIRGRGRALSLDIRSETGKDCHIYGWGIPITRQERT